MDTMYTLVLLEHNLHAMLVFFRHGEVFTQVVNYEREGR